MLKLNKQVEMEIVKHETCQQYVARRLSEGWKIIKQEGFKVILQSPEGIIRPVDIRNDVETLRPNAPGDLTELIPFPGTGEANWEDVDEETPDEDSTYVWVDMWTYAADLYNLPAHSQGSGTINKMTVYARCNCDYGETYEEIIIKSNTKVTYGDWHDLVTDWETYSQEWALNPADSQDWEWADIDALQIGISMEPEADYGYCTQVYVEVDYTPVVVYIPRHSGTVGVLMI